MLQNPGRGNTPHAKRVYQLSTAVSPTNENPAYAHVYNIQFEKKQKISNSEKADGEKERTNTRENIVMMMVMMMMTNAR